MSIHTKWYGRNVRARITLRKRLRREPTAEEFQEAISDNLEKFEGISRADIARAYNSGDEVGSVASSSFLFSWLTDLSLSTLPCGA